MHRKTVTEVAIDEKTKWNELLERVGASSDKAAFTALFAHFSPRLKAFLMQGGNLSAENAEEVIQETMIKVWRKAPTYSSKQASASTWIYTIARNTRIDWFRKANRQNPDDLNADDLYEGRDEPVPLTSLTRYRNSRLVGDALKELPQDQSAVLSLMYFQGKSGQQIADDLQIPLGTVKSRVRLALQKLQIRLAGDVEPIGEGAGV